MRLVLFTLAAALLLPLAANAATAPKQVSPNLLKNPGAELGAATPDSAATPLPVPAWETTGGFFAAAYDGFRWAPDPPNRTKGAGSKYFVGCFSVDVQAVKVGTATQTVSIARWAGAIDKGTIALKLGAELGGYDGTENRATAQALFLDAGGKVLGKRVIVVGPTYLQRQGVTRVEPRSATGAAPVGARQLKVTLSGSRTGSGPCGFVDNVSAVLLAVPKAK